MRLSFLVSLLFVLFAFASISSHAIANKQITPLGNGSYEVGDHSPGQQPSSFNVCLRDDRTGDSFQFNTATGEYIFTHCGFDDFTMTGRGHIIRAGCDTKLVSNLIEATYTACSIESVKTGSATIKRTVLGPTFIIKDKNTTDSDCSCQSVAQFTLFSNSADSGVIRAERTDGRILDYFGIKAADGRVERITSINVTDQAGKITSIYFDEQSRPVRIRAHNGTVFKFTWVSPTRVAVRAIDPTGKFQANIFVDLVPFGNIPNVSAVSPKSVGVKARGGQRIRLLGPTVQVPQTLVQAKTAIAAPSGQATVRVTKCGAPANFADVSMNIHEFIPFGRIYSRPGTRIGDGLYAVTIPILPTVGSTAQDICSKIATALAYSCVGIKAITPTVPIICAGIASAVITLTEGAGAAAATQIIAGCEAGFTALSYACNTINMGPDPFVPDAPTVASLVCGHVKGIVDIFNPFGYVLQPYVVITDEFGPFGEALTAPEQKVSFEGPFPGFSVMSEALPTIENFSISPVDPAPLQSYVATVQINCVSPNTVARISIVGTDGYADSTSCPVSGDGACRLAVPGAEDGVVDTVTVELIGFDNIYSIVVVVF